METESFIAGKDASLESSVSTMQTRLSALGFHIEERSWLNPVDNAWSVHIRDRDCHLLFTNGKGASKQAALASALGEAQPLQGVTQRDGRAGIDGPRCDRGGRDRPRARHGFAGQNDAGITATL